MLVIAATFENGKFIPDQPLSIPQNRKVLLTIDDNADTARITGQNGYMRLQKYKGTLRREIDYKKELAEARDDKYQRFL